MLENKDFYNQKTNRQTNEPYLVQELVEALHLHPQSFLPQGHFLIFWVDHLAVPLHLFVTNRAHLHAKFVLSTRLIQQKQTKYKLQLNNHEICLLQCFLWRKFQMAMSI